MRRQAVTSPSAPHPIGPYSAALKSGPFLFVSGQVPIDPATGDLVGGDIRAQTRRVLANLGALLEAAGLTFGHVARTTVFLADMGDFAAMIEVYAEHFSAPYPSTSTVQAARLPRDARIEI